MPLNDCLYPKRYATIVSRDGFHITVQYHQQARYATELYIGWRCGRCHSAELLPGVVVKVYKRPQDNHPKFRRIGR